MDAAKKPAKKRSTPRPTRATDIAALTNEMIEHIKAARNHAVTTRDLTGEAQLLPRPSQKELAQRAGVSESSVSRCLKHKAARELRILWELALDLDQIIGYRSSRSSGRELQLR